MSPENQKDKGEESSIQKYEKNALEQGSFDMSAFFKKDKYFLFVHKKIEKIVAALHLITNLMEDKDPIKWDIRKIGSELLNLSATSREIPSFYKSGISEKIKQKIFEAVSLLEVAMFANLISSMNVSVLKREFSGLLGNIEEMENKAQRNTNPFEKNFFESEMPELLEKEIENSLRTNSPKDIKDNIETVEEKTFRTEKSQLQLKEFSPVSVKKNQRKSIIINLLKRKREVMIKDIVGLINNCSEKTIQRELLSLVEEGVLKKSGERRWTKYSLV